MFLLQILRGDTHNYIFVDESCFVRPTAYGEVVPMLLTDNAHMVLTSSHKAGQDTRSFIDMNSLRRSEILVNNIAHVCPNHILSMLSNNVTAMSCLCYLFHQPHHITADADYRRILDAFSHKSVGPNHEEDESADFKTAMLSEIGILPPGASLHDLEDNVKRQLATKGGSARFSSNLIHVSDYVLAGKRELLFEKDVMVYIDPSPTDVGRSLHAMCFVARAEHETNRSPNDTRFHYVLLAVEEFATDEVEHNGDSMSALANVYMTTITVLTKLYGGYFTNYIVALEANSIHVGPFWEKCASLFSCNAVLKSYGITILSTTIPSPKEMNVRSKKTNKLKTASRIKPYDVNSYRLNLLSEESKTKDTRSYRIGYALGANKVSKIYNFFSAMYNPSTGNVSTVVCSKEVWGWTIMRANDSIPYYIARKLEVLEIRPTVNHVTGKTTYKIGGKRTDKNGGFVQDDLAIAVVMSVCLCEEIFSRQYKGHLVRLEPDGTNLLNYELEEEQ